MSWSNITIRDPYSREEELQNQISLTKFLLSEALNKNKFLQDELQNVYFAAVKYKEIVIEMKGEKPITLFLKEDSSQVIK